MGWEGETLGSISKDQPCNANEYKEEEQKKQQGRNPILGSPCRAVCVVGCVCVFAIVNAVVEARAHDTLASPRLNGNQGFLSSFAYRSSYRVEQSIFESYQQQATRSTTRKALNRTQRKEKKGEKRNERFSSLLRPALCLCLQIEIVFFDNVPLFILMNESNVMLLLLLHWILQYTIPSSFRGLIYYSEGFFIPVIVYLQTGGTRSSISNSRSL